MTTRWIAATVVLFVACNAPQDRIAAGAQAAPAAQFPATGTLSQLLAPIALYPDQLLAQMLMSAGVPAKITELDQWLKANQKLKGTALQDAAVKAGFDPSFVALVLFPQVVGTMASQIAWTTALGVAFTSDRSAVFASIQKLRLQAKDVGTLKSSPQQAVETKTTSAGEQVIVIEPTNPQVVYVPQYNTQVVYTQAPTQVVVVQEDDDAGEAVAAGLIGFTAGIAIGAAMDNNYYYGPYGWRGGAYMYNDAWDDYYDHREDAREDWQDHREDLVDERGDRAENRTEQRTDRAGTTQEQRTDRQQTRTENRPETQAQRTERATQAQGARARRHRRNVRVAQEVLKPAVTAREAGASPRRNGPRAARTPSQDIRTANRNARPVLVGRVAAAAARARAVVVVAAAAAGEGFGKVDTHDQDDRSVRVCMAGAGRIRGDRRRADRGAAHVCRA